MRQHLAIVEATRAERGATGPFERITHWFSSDHDELRRLEAAGVTGVMVMPWPMYSDLTQAQKHEAATRYAETIIRGA